MDILQDLHINNEYLAHLQEPARRPRRKFKTRTCQVFLDEMSDFEFKRTFRFSKDGVRHLTALLGILKY